MFGVFSPYGLQLIHDWIRGDASADGQAYGESVLSRRRPSFRSLSRQAQPSGSPAHRGLLKVIADSPDDTDLLDPDLQALQAQLAVTSRPGGAKTPAGSGHVPLDALDPGGAARAAPLSANFHVKPFFPAWLALLLQ